jgi:hypothetical protein
MSRYLIAAFLILFGLGLAFGFTNAVLTVIAGICAVFGGILWLIGQ